MTKPTQRASARLQSRASARDQLAAAHQQMSQAEIAAHALLLAMALESARRLHVKTEQALNDANRSVVEGMTLARTMQEHIALVDGLFRQGRKREARDMLKKAAAMPMVDEPPTFPVHATEWDMALFMPVGDQEASQ